MYNNVENYERKKVGLQHLTSYFQIINWLCGDVYNINVCLTKKRRHYLSNNPIHATKSLAPKISACDKI